MPHGICFLCFKAAIESSKLFSDVLDFNYKFKNPKYNFIGLSNFEQIKIQTNHFQNMKTLPEFIYRLTGRGMRQNEFYTYSYTCIDSKDWNKQEDFVKLEPMFIKYVNNLPNGYQADFNQEEHQYQEISKFKFTRYGITKNGCSMLASGIETFNYTKLPHAFEKQFFYTYLFSLYQKLYLEKLDNAFEKKEKQGSRLFLTFLKELWQRPLTEDDFGSLYQKEITTALRIGKKI